MGACRFDGWADGCLNVCRCGVVAGYIVGQACYSLVCDM